MPRAIIGTLTVCGIIVAALPAVAAAGACWPDSDSASKSVLVCGSGQDAARTIADTISPSHRIALDWRAYEEPAGTQPHGDRGLYQNLMIRVSDGAILAVLGAVYRDPGNSHGNDFFVVAAWSANSRFLVATFDDPHAPLVDVYTFEQGDDALSGPIDLQPVIIAAVQASTKNVQDDGSCRVFVSTARPMMIDNRGVVHGTVTVTDCSTGLHGPYDVRLQVKHDSSSPEPSRLSVKALSVAASKAK